MSDDALDQRLTAAAREIQRNAHAPYSGFRVGAALLTDDGTVFTGANVENVSYGLTICAERAAVCAAVSAGHRQIAAIAVVASTGIVAPCGACRQVLAEFAAPDMRVIMQDLADPGATRTVRLAELLPMPFSAIPAAPPRP